MQRLFINDTEVLVKNFKILPCLNQTKDDKGVYFLKPSLAFSFLSPMKTPEKATLKIAEIEGEYVGILYNQTENNTEYETLYNIL